MHRALVAAVLAVAACSSSSTTVNGDAGALAEIGAHYVEQRGCPMCHQTTNKHTLSGNVDAVAGTFAYPANLTPDRATGIGGWADAQIIRAIRYGFDDENEELCPTMPRFDGMGDVEAEAIVAYLRSLSPVTHAVPESYCPPVKPSPGPDMAMPDM
jgi:hypothetical protein